MSARRGAPPLPDARAQPFYLFVYGTLLRGGRGHALLRTAQFVRRASTKPCYSLVSLGAWPGLVAGGRDKVEGELYRCLPRLLPTLDAYEECPEVYRRERVALLGSSPQAITYVLRKRGRYRSLPGGRWRLAPAALYASV